MNTDAVPLVFFDVRIFHNGTGYIRVTTFMSPDKTEVEHTAETGPTVAGPWRELKRHL